jgi:hypothetical protein
VLLAGANILRHRTHRRFSLSLLSAERLATSVRTTEPTDDNRRRRPLPCFAAIRSSSSST